MDVAAIPGVDSVELPGVHGDEEHAPDSFEIEDLDTTPPIHPSLRRRQWS